MNGLYGSMRELQAINYVYNKNSIQLFVLNGITSDYFTTYKYQPVDVIIYSIVYATNILFCFVFNEIVIIKICNLDYNTNKNIKKREREDTLSTLYSIELTTINPNNFE